VGVDAIIFTPFSETTNIEPGGNNNEIQYKLNNVYSGDSRFNITGSVNDTFMGTNEITVAKNINPYVDDYTNESLRIDSPGVLKQYNGIVVRTGIVQVDDYNVAGGDITLNNNTDSSDIIIRCSNLTCGTSNNINGKDGVIFKNIFTTNRLYIINNPREFSLIVTETIINTLSFSLNYTNNRIEFDIDALGSIGPLDSKVFTVTGITDNPVIKTSLYNYSGTASPYIITTTDNTSIFTLTIYNLDSVNSITDNIIIYLILF
jgi:hypothetical protein